MTRPRPTACLSALLALTACTTDTPAAQMPPDPSHLGTPVLVADAMAAIYGGVRHNKGWLGCAAQGERVWLSHGSTNSPLGTALVAADASGTLLAVRRDGTLHPLTSTPPEAQWRAGAEGLILAAAPRQLWALNFDNGGGGVRGELFVWEGDAPPVAVEGALANHNRALAIVPAPDGRAALVAAHTPSVGWPSLEVVREPASALPRAVGVPASGTVGVQTTPVVYRGRVYAFTPTVPTRGAIPTHPALGRLAADGAAAEVLIEQEADLWPADAATEHAWTGGRHTYWPQARQGIETPDGLFVTSPGGVLWWLADDGAGGLRTPAAFVESQPGRVYLGHAGRLLALDEDGALLLREADAWRALGVVPSMPGRAQFACMTDRGALVALGTRGRIGGAAAPTWLAVWPR